MLEIALLASPPVEEGHRLVDSQIGAETSPTPASSSPAALRPHEASP
jgi:hypothetical protein